MKTKTKKAWIAGMIGAVSIIFAARVWAQSACDERPGEFVENFDYTTFKDIPNCSVAAWPSGPITLNKLGANLDYDDPHSMGARIYVCDGGDFTGDGFPDLIGLDISGQHQTLPFQSRLLLVRNQFEDSDGDGEDDDGIVFQIDATKVFEEFDTHTGPASITVADYNNDGLLDFFFYRNGNDSYSYSNFLATMYINVGTEDEPDFNSHDLSPNLDFTDRFQDSSIYANWAANHFSSVDIDRDGDIDILVASQDKIFLLRNPGPSNFTLSAWSVAELNYDQRTGFPCANDTQRGGSAVNAGDFDGDGDIDVVAGSVMNVSYLVYYENDGMGSFTRKEIPISVASCTGTVAISVADFNIDGLLDIFAATDRWNAGNMARMWLLKNKGFIEGAGEEDPGHVDWEFKCLKNCDPIIPPDYDVDMSACLDFDLDGDMDVILADANHSGNYYLIINELANVYNLLGTATSTNVTEGVLDPRQYAITKVQFTRLQQGVLNGSSTGLSITYEVSNNGGQNWEPYAVYSGSGIQNISSGLPVHDFKSFGCELKWRAVLRAQEDDMTEYDGASYETPAIDEIRLTYWYVARGEYSRSSAAATIVDRTGEKRKLLIGSSFIFPGFEGQLRAYDVTDMTLSGSQYSTLKTVTESNLSAASGRTTAEGVDIFWDAGQLLDDRNPDSRTIYTALRSGSVWNRTLFDRDHVAALRSLLNDQNNDNAGLIDFIRGEDRYWKLGDINHSSPVVVGPPVQNSIFMVDPSYEQFLADWETRDKVVYVGANDGMLHCFDINTGEERWAFIPYNLLPKLRNMRAMDPATGQRYYVHDIYVDGSPTVADVKISGQWKTVLVCGQGAGYGSGPANYYFALDITDPDNPLPLWEVTHTNMGETWSVPEIGKVNHSGTERWVAFMGSGYDNLPIGNPTTNPVTGNRFYVVRLDTGAIIRNISVSNVNSNSFTGDKRGYRYPNIYVAIPGSPTAIDTDSNGFTNSVYVGDLDGRLYRMDVTGQNANQWSLQAIYTDWLNYPIVTKPALWIDQLSGSTTPHVFFGTGGHETAPADRVYSFVELIDTGGNTATIGWYIGDPTVLNNPAGEDVGDLDPGDKVWADPVIEDNIVYFSTLRGNIESNNPCVNLAEPTGKLFARYLRSVAGNPAGATAFKTADAVPPESWQMVSKARQAVTLGERIQTGNVAKREVYIQEYNSTVEMLEQSISGSQLQIKSWREIYKIIR